MWYVYILKSQRDGKRYIGSTNNIERRIAEHNNGKVFSTKMRYPFVLLFSESYVTEREARTREHFFKTHKGYNVLKKLLDRAVV